MSKSNHIVPNKELRTMLKGLEAEGWEISRSNSSHLKCRAPNGRHVFFSSTPSDWRAIKNFAAECKRTVALAPRP